LRLVPSTPNGGPVSATAGAVNDVPPLATERTLKTAKLLDTIGSNRKVVVLTHDNPDPDSLASAAALSTLIQQKLKGRSVVIGAGGIVARAENRALLSHLNVSLQPAKQCLTGFKGPVVLVDTQPGRKNNSLPPGMTPAAVIDHHPDWGNNENVPFVDLRESYGATSTILTEYLQEAEVPIEPRIATALFYGISSETRQLGRETKPGDIVASQFLYPYVNKRLLSEIENPPLPRAYFSLIGRAIRGAVLHGDVLVARVESVTYPDAVAQLADFFIRLDEVSWAVCLAPFRGSVYVSVRTKIPDASAGLLLASILPPGGAGGHGMIAGGRIRAPRKRWREAASGIVRDLLAALGRSAEAPRPLLQVENRRRTPPREPNRPT
jgi:nanoRNase/pAp phosphatase (c-di-AMP/oligoRNAs hydrolase)